MLRNDICSFLKTIPENVTLVAATKYVDAIIMNKMLEAGINNFGENRVESFLSKYDSLNNKNIVWHFIGHLQRNKAKQVVSKIDYLHSLDSLKLAELINKERTTPLNCFIEVSINGEKNKNGVYLENLKDFIIKIQEYKNINLVGFMMMAIQGSDHESLISQFSKLKEVKTEIENSLKINIPYLSMGMSDDYKEAIDCGATHIRLGRILFKNE